MGVVEFAGGEVRKSKRKKMIAEKPSWIRHEGMQIFSIDVQPGGLRLATGGGDHKVSDSCILFSICQIATWPPFQIGMELLSGSLSLSLSLKLRNWRQIDICCFPTVI